MLTPSESVNAKKVKLTAAKAAWHCIQAKDRSNKETRALNQITFPELHGAEGWLASRTALPERWFHAARQSARDYSLMNLQALST